MRDTARTANGIKRAGVNARGDQASYSSDRRSRSTAAGCCHAQAQPGRGAPPWGAAGGRAGALNSHRPQAADWSFCDRRSRAH